MADGFTRFGRRMAGRVMEWTAQERSHAVAILVAVALYGAHYLVWCWPQPWFIEDAAITFSYARNLVDGEGLVPYPGGEPVEGYSNALWMFLLALFQVVRLDPWSVSKVMGFVFGAATLPISYALVRRAVPGRPPGAAPLVAPFLLACSTQFVLWNDSGLENSLFSFLLALGAWRLAVEIQDGEARPLSALAFFLLTMTRPDGAMYAAIALLTRTVGTLRRRQWLALPAWILALGLPWAAYNAWRLDYFGWPYPNTYYAKQRNIDLLGWNTAGWKQFKDYARFYLFAYSAPIVALALVGWSRWRKWVVLVLSVLFAVLVVWNGRAGVPASVSDWWIPNVANNWAKITVWYMLGASVLMGVLTLVRPGWEVRATLWAAWCSGVFFWVWSGQEWMKGFRWGSLLAVPFFVLFALGASAWVRRAPLWASGVGVGIAAFLSPNMPTLPWTALKAPLLSIGVSLQEPELWVQWVALGAVAGLVVVAGWLAEGRGRALAPTRPIPHLVLLAVVLALPNIGGSWSLANDPETSPNSVHRRVNYMKRAQATLDLDEVTLLDVDMGAHMWWASDWTIGDMAGLVDVPMARHIKYPKTFVDDYVFGELRPDFAHVHGSWAKTTKIPQNPKWKEQYVEIPGYGGGKTLHVGNHVRKDHLVGARYTGPEGRQVVFDGGVVLEGWDVPAALVASGGKLYVDTTWRVLARRSNFRLVVFLADEHGHVHSAEVAPGYDWYRPDRWKPGEYVYGRWSVPIPESLAPGTYDLGFVVFDQDTGTVLEPLPAGATAADPDAPPPAPSADTRYMAGELRLPGVVTVGTVDQAIEAANKGYEDGLTRAANGDCEGAALAFRTARRFVARNENWYENRREAMDASRVQCLIREAETVDDLLGKSNILSRARRIDHHNADLIAACEPLAASLEGLGDEARDDEAWQLAYDRYHAALRVDPFRVQARVKAEAMRNKRLGLQEDGTDAPVKRKERTPPRTEKLDVPDEGDDPGER